MAVHKDKSIGLSIVFDSTSLTGTAPKSMSIFFVYRDAPDEPPDTATVTLLSQGFEDMVKKEFTLSSLPFETR